MARIWAWHCPYAFQAQPRSERIRCSPATLRALARSYKDFITLVEISSEHLTSLSCGKLG